MTHTEELLISTEALRQAAHEFSLASQQNKETVQHLNEVILELEKQWSGASKQVFYQDYKEWRQMMEGMALYLGNIAREMDAMAERYEKEDRE